MKKIKKVVTKLNDIAAGHVKEATGHNETLAKVRMSICRGCPLYDEHITLGARCNPNLYIDPKTKKDC